MIKIKKSFLYKIVFTGITCLLNPLLSFKFKDKFFRHKRSYPTQKRFLNKNDKVRIS